MDRISFSLFAIGACVTVYMVASMFESHQRFKEDEKATKCFEALAESRKESRQYLQWAIECAEKRDWICEKYKEAR